MIRPTRAIEPVQYLIWGTSGLISMLLGIGLAFFLWLRLHETTPGAMVPAVGAIGLGIGLLGLGSGRPFEGRLLLIFAASLVASFLVGSPLFTALG